MKIEKFYSKLEKLFDDNSSAEHFHFYNGTNDLYFCIDPYAVYMLPGHQGWTCKPDTMPVEKLETVFNEAVNTGKLATVTKGRDNLNRCVLRLTGENGLTVYIQEKFTRIFPANALYYVTSKYGPVLVSIEDKQFIPVAVIMPLRFDSVTFTEKGD